jgi:hypothetical protein
MTDPLLARVAVLLLPGGDGGGLDAALTADPRVELAARRALAALAPADVAAGLTALAAADPEAHAALLLVVATAHYADADVRHALGYDGPQAIALPDDDLDADLAPLLARVQARGPRYREAPSS